MPAAATANSVEALATFLKRCERARRHGDFIITLGAGSIGSIGPRILEALRARKGAEA